MKTKLSAKTKRAIFIYIIIFAILYVVVEVLPKVTNLFESTEVLEVGNLALTCETTGYLLKDEYVCIADESGKISYTEDVGTVVKKGHKLCDVAAKSSNNDSEDSDKSDNRYSKYIERLGKAENVTSSYKAPISGVYSQTIDGYEGLFTPDRMKTVKKSKVEGLDYDSADLNRSSINKGEPVYKVSGDDKWYVLCWVSNKDAKNYKDGESVTLKLSDGDVAAKVYYTNKENDCTRIIFCLDVYYENFTSTRKTDMTIVASADEGLIVSNSCIVKKDGKKGVYVVDKNGRYKFTRIKVISSDDKNSVLEDTSFYDDGNQIYTVNVYDKVLKHPESALKKDLKGEQ